jgi:hypothetical protein
MKLPRRALLAALCLFGFSAPALAEGAITLTLPAENHASVDKKCAPEFTADSQYLICGNAVWDTASGTVTHRVPSLVTGYEIRPEKSPKVEETRRVERFQYMVAGMKLPGFAPYPKSSNFTDNQFHQLSFAYQAETGLFHYFLATKVRQFANRQFHSVVISVGTVNAKSGKTVETWSQQINTPDDLSSESSDAYHRYFLTLAAPIFGGDAWAFRDDKRTDHIVSTVRKNDEWHSAPRDKNFDTPPAFPGGRGDELIVGIARGTITYADYAKLTQVDRKSGAILSQVKFDSGIENRFINSWTPRSLLISPDGRYTLLSTQLSGDPDGRTGFFIATNDTAGAQRFLALRDDAANARANAWHEDKARLEAAMNSNTCAVLTGKWYTGERDKPVSDQPRFGYDTRTTLTMSCDESDRLQTSVRRSARYYYTATDNDGGMSPRDTVGIATARSTNGFVYRRGTRNTQIRFFFDMATVTDELTAPLPFYSTSGNGSAQFHSSSNMKMRYDCQLSVIIDRDKPVPKLLCENGSITLLRSETYAQPDFVPLGTYKSGD